MRPSPRKRPPGERRAELKTGQKGGNHEGANAAGEMLAAIPSRCSGLKTSERRPDLRSNAG